MTKDDLANDLKEHKGSYLRFLTEAERDCAKHRWGSGVGAPWSLEPYRLEMLGIKPGRMLKGDSEPAPRRYCLSYDSRDHVIHLVRYGKLAGPPDNRDWLRSDEFYKYSDRVAKRYVFGDTFRKNPDSELTRIVAFELLDKSTQIAYQIESDGLEYTETTYSLDANSNYRNVTTRWPDGRYPDRNLEIVGSGLEVQIFEIRDDRKILVYPA